LPAQQATNLQILAGLQAQLSNEEDALNTARQQQVYLQTLINQYRTLQGPSKTVDGAPTGLPAIEKELESQKSQLAVLSSQYTDRHPDVQRLKEQIAKTERMREELKAALKNEANGAGEGGSTTLAHDVADPSQNSPVLQLQSQLQANRTEIANREQAITELKAKVGDYQARLNNEPVREQQLADLTRGYDQSKAYYDDLLKKENESKMATSMEQMQKGERFRVIDPPSFPLKPAFPDRLKFCGFGLGFGLVLGVLVAGAFEFLDDRLHSEKQLKDMLPMKILSEIPEILTAADERASKKRMLVGWAVTALAFAVILAGSVYSYRHS
jgi:succinoglycan biosynthesis transport protein ExoP